MILKNASLVAASCLIINSACYSEIQTDTAPTRDDGSSYDNTPRVTMDFENADLKDALKAFSKQANINFIATDAIKNKKVTIFLNNVTIKDALTSILDANSLTYEKQGDNVYLIKPTGKRPIDTITRVYRLNYLQVYDMSLPQESQSGGGPTIVGSPAIAEAGSVVSQALGQEQKNTAGGSEKPKNIIEIVKSLLSKNGMIVADRRNNSLIITDIPEAFPHLETAIKELDVEPAQVMIEAQIIETTTNAIKRIGIEYGSETQTARVTWGTGTGGQNMVAPVPFPMPQKFIKDAFQTNLAGSGLFRYGTLTAADTELVLKLLAQDEDTRYLSKPKIMTINNEPATIKITANTAIGVDSVSVTQTGQSISKAERYETGISLRVIPQVNQKGEIFLYVEPFVARAQASTFFTTQFMDPQKRSASSTVMVKDGNTVFIGGLIQTNNFKTNRKIPFLGDIPILGEPFKSRYRKADDSELIILITPHIVSKRDTEYVSPEDNTERGFMVQRTISNYEDKPGRPKTEDEPLSPREKKIGEAILKHSTPKDETGNPKKD